MSIFWTLVKNDIGIARHRRSFSTFWIRFYMALALISGFIIYTVLLLKTNIPPNFIPIIPAFLVFACFTSIMILVKKEWRDNTVGWWLTLPYSRKMLLGAKLTASFIRFLRDSLLLFLASIVLYTEGIIIRPNIWQNYSLTELLSQIAKAYLQILPVGILLMVFGMLITIVRHTRLRPALPLLGILLWGSISLFYSTFFKTIFSPGPGSSWIFSIPGLAVDITTIFKIIASFIIAFFVFLLNAFLLEKYAEA